MTMRLRLAISLGILGIICLTFGTSYSFFDFAQKETSDNILLSGKITFLYTDTSGAGNEITINDSLPMSDELGKIQVEDGQYFDFKITSSTFSDYDVPYEVTIRKNKNSTLDEKFVKLYLTEFNGISEKEILINNFNQLKQTNRVNPNKYIEKTIYQGVVNANTNNYEKNFRLRMWVDKEHLYNNEHFTISINVYSNGTVVMNDEKMEKQDVLYTSENRNEIPQVEDHNQLLETNPIPETPIEIEDDSSLQDSTDTFHNSIPNTSVPPENSVPPIVDSTLETEKTPELNTNPEINGTFTYPDWGEIWATLKIPDIGLDLPIYHGDTADIMEKGICHYAGSYFPGQGSSIILAAHNSKEHFMYLPNLAIGSKITIVTNYGIFVYEVTSTKIIKDTDEESLPIQTEEELLMMYTCYPVGVDGYKTERYVVYAKLVNENYSK